MKMFKFRYVSNFFTSVLTAGLGRTLLVRFLLVSILPMGFVAWTSIQNSIQTFTAYRTDGLAAVAHAKYSSLSAYFSQTTTNLRLESELANTVGFLSALQENFQSSGKPLAEFTKSYQWAILEDEFGTDISHVLTTYSYIDILLMDPQGNILYSVRRDNDLGSNLFTGELSKSKFSIAAQKALVTGLTVYSDIEHYPPFDNQLSSFLIQAVVDEYGDRLGAIAVHLSLDSMSSIMDEDVGLGGSGEAYLIGEDFLLRSNAKLDINSAVLETKVDTIGTRLWHSNLENEDNINASEISRGKYNNYLDTPVLGVSLPIEFAGTRMLMIAEFNEADALAPVQNIITRFVFIVLATVFIVLLFSIFSVRSITRPIIELTNWARQLSMGALNKQKITTPNNEIAVLNRAFGELVDSLQSVSTVMGDLSIGDLSAQIVPRNNEDILLISLNSLNKSLQSVVDQANTIASGVYDADIKPRSSQDSLGSALQTMTKNLRLGKANNIRQSWLKTSQADLAEVMSGQQDLASLSQAVVTYLTKRLGGQVGLFYVVDPLIDDQFLSFSGGYAFERNNKLEESFGFGEGLAGQAALDQEIISVEDLPTEYFHVSSSLGQSTPSNLLAIPLINNHVVHGVIEIGGFSKFDEDSIEFSRMSAESIAIALESCFSMKQTKALLEETQRQSEELQKQQDALQSTNVNLKEQTSKLQASEEELKQQSEELRVANEELEEKQNVLRKKNKEITAAQKSLEAQAKDLELSSKYKSEFLANMSHELRTPLNSMLILSKSLADNKQGNLSQEQTEDATVVYEGGKDLLALINDIMDLSKVEAGMLDVHSEIVDLQHILTKIERQFARTSSEKNLQFLIEMDDAVPDNIISDGQRLEQILKNFLSNSFKFTEKGSVTIRVQPTPPDVELRNTKLSCESTIAFSVIDTGIGISHDKQSLIFDAFQQQDGSTSRKYGGTGLGLSISREIAKLLEGEIHLQSEPQQGSTFTLYLPREATLEEALSESNNTENQGAPRKDNKSDETVITTRAMVTAQDSAAPIESWIDDDRAVCQKSDHSLLIIEDDQKFASLLLRLAHERKMKALVTNKGREGVLLAQRYQPSGIILDRGLPDIDGSVVLEQLKYHIDTRHIPIHIISGVDSSQAGTTGAVNVLRKPVDSESLAAIFEQIEKTVTDSLKTILVVEDDHATQRAVAHAIDSEGVEISFVDNMNEALNLLISTTFACIVVDLSLPDVEGVEVVEKISAAGNAANTPIIVYTARELSEDEYRRISAEAASVVVKGRDSVDRLVDDISLFLHKVDVQKGEDPLAGIKMHHEADAILEGRKVLLVDDDMRNVFALSRQLEELGIEVTPAENGEVALEKLEASAEPFELVLMDIMMPVMDGFEAMKHLRQLPLYKDTPVIALTAKAMPEDRAKCIEAGASEYLTKPVDMEKLASLLRVWLFKSNHSVETL